MDQNKNRSTLTEGVCPEIDPFLLERWGFAFFIYFTIKSDITLESVSKY